YINFTPSQGASLPALEALAERTGSLIAGKDGKTGETLMKTVLAPMFAARNLRVMSWVGHNIFGNRDGVILDDPANKAAKVGPHPGPAAQSRRGGGGSGTPPTGGTGGGPGPPSPPGVSGARRWPCNSPGRGATACSPRPWPSTSPASLNSRSAGAAAA